MLSITRFTCENMREGCVTDNAKPAFAFTVADDKNDTSLKSAEITVNGWTKVTNEQIGIIYDGMPLVPFSSYEAHLRVISSKDEEAEATLTFETGRMDIPWSANWISDKNYIFTEKKVSPVPMVFRKKFSVEKKVKSAKIYSTAMGIYELMINKEKVGSDYFAPGFTSYKSQLQYQTYDITEMVSAEKEYTLDVVVAGGWAVGSFVYTRNNRVTADRQALLLELHFEYDDGTTECINSDESWFVTEDGNYKMADLYDGETYDASIDESKIVWRDASIEKLRVAPEIIADYSAPVREHEVMKPVSCTERENSLIYDFGQNFAGVISLDINGKKGQVITVKHAEILNPDGSLNTAFLRTAKACVTYTCKEGKQQYSPRLTYMGFRYIEVSGIAKEDIIVEAKALYSDIEQIGKFECSNSMINRLQENILWSSKSNFVDIPTDCPQRDERMGWTGDIAVFAPTACFNFDMSAFLNKWLKDVRAEQLKTGGIPNTVPAQGFGFPATMPSMAIDFWGDATVLVPWAMYQSFGDKKVLEDNYNMMKKYVDACKRWAGLFSVGNHRFIWHTPSVFHFGDWVAPDVPKMSQWQGRSKWTATASLNNTSRLLSKIAGILGKKDDEEKYAKLSDNVAKAYKAVFTDGNGKLKEEFQTAYVLPLYFGMFEGKEKENAVKNLVSLVEKSDYCIGTGFPGTPYILFALADNGCADVAYKMLMNQKCPSWLYEVKSGATTIWERWDGLDENGVCPIGDDGTDMMISYNHYASGAVGDFLYRRIAGIEQLAPGYRKFRIAPVLGGDITFAKGEIDTPYGVIKSEWCVKGKEFKINVNVPMGTCCELLLPDGSKRMFNSGTYSEHVTM